MYNANVVLLEISKLTRDENAITGHNNYTVILNQLMFPDCKLTLKQPEEN